MLQLQNPVVDKADQAPPPALIPPPPLLPNAHSCLFHAGQAPHCHKPRSCASDRSAHTKVHLDFNPGPCGTQKHLRFTSSGAIWTLDRGPQGLYLGPRTSDFVGKRTFSSEAMRSAVMVPSFFNLSRRMKASFSPRHDSFPASFCLTAALRAFRVLEFGLCRSRMLLEPLTFLEPACVIISVVSIAFCRP